MILTPHLIFGAMIASKIQNPILAVFLALLSHYLLDIVPHAEYSVDNLRKEKWKKSLPDVLKVFLDFSIGIGLILMFSQKTPIIFIASFFSILPDGFSVLNSFLKVTALENHTNFHRKNIHFLKYKKISNIWRILSQALVVTVSVLILILD